jgi:signal recognition particle receptor subunit beta
MMCRQRRRAWLADPSTLCQESLRSSWSAYFANSDGLVLVVDSSDRAVIATVRRELDALLGNLDLGAVPLLVFANKQDLSGAMSAVEMSAELALDKIKDRPYTIQACSALNGDGIEEGLTWLAACIKPH